MQAADGEQFILFASGAEAVKQIAECEHLGCPQSFWVLGSHAALQFTAHNYTRTVHRKDECHVFQSLPAESAEKVINNFLQKGFHI